MRAVGALCCLLACSSVAVAAGLGDLGQLERESVDDALVTGGFTIDPAPDGKHVEVIHVVNHEVFSRRDYFLTWFNLFHRTTRENVIRREVLLRPGQLYDQVIVDETVRNLQASPNSNVVVIVPVKNASPRAVDLLVVTRDVWSLRLNTEFEIQAQRLIYLAGSVSENNLFGWRKTVALNYFMNQSLVTVGPSYVDPNIRGTRLRFSVAANAYFDRKHGDLEGTSSRARIDYPLFSLASRWGAWLSGGHANYVVRPIDENRLRSVDLKAFPEDEMLPFTYRVRSVSIDGGAVRSFGSAVIQRVSFGHGVSAVRPDFTPDFPSNDPEVRAAFRKEVFPRSERVSAPFLSYMMFVPRYRTYRDLNGFDFREDYLIGPEYSARVSRAATLLGSEHDFTGLSTGAAWSFDVGGGYQRVGAGWGARFQDRRLIDQTTSLSVYGATPLFARAVRVLASAGTDFLRNNTTNGVYSLGGDSGLRGYVIGDFQSRGPTAAQWLAHLEVRTTALKLAAFRAGTLVFYDVGDAASSLDQLRAFQDVGFGIRFLIPHTGAYVTRFDWAFPLQDSMRTRAGWPGRISLGFRQAF